MVTQERGQDSDMGSRPRLQSREGWPKNGRRDGDGEGLAQALGWFSIGLGLAQVAAPREIARFIGLSGDDGNRDLMLALGMREIASGVGILTQSRPAGWVWARVAGDAMDLALLGAAMTSDRVQHDRVVAATAAVVGVTVLDLLCGQRLSRHSGAPSVG